MPAGVALARATLRADPAADCPCCIWAWARDDCRHQISRSEGRREVTIARRAGGTSRRGHRGSDRASECQGCRHLSYEDAF